MAIIFNNIKKHIKLNYQLKICEKYKAFISCCIASDGQKQNEKKICLQYFFQIDFAEQK